MNIRRFFGAAVLFVGLTAMALPANAARPIPKQLAKQRHRITWGVKHGKLTKREARVLRRNERTIQHNYWRDRRSGGHLSGREHASDKSMLRQQSHLIHKKNHNHARPR